MPQPPELPPELWSERLHLRGLVESDAREIQRLAGDVAIAATTLHIPHPYRDGMAEQWILTHSALHAAGQAVILGITRRADAALVGGIGLRLEPAHRRAELGYWIGKPFWGLGYATEAGRTLRDWAFRHLDLHRLEAHYFQANPASGRVLQKLGLRREGLLRQAVWKWGQVHSIIVTSLLRPEWEALAEPGTSGGADGPDGSDRSDGSETTP